MSAVVAVAYPSPITALVVGDDNGVDAFDAVQALQLVTYQTIGYMVACGLAKSGSRNRYADSRYDQNA